MKHLRDFYLFRNYENCFYIRIFKFEELQQNLISVDPEVRR